MLVRYKYIIAYCIKKLLHPSLLSHTIVIPNTLPITTWWNNEDVYAQCMTIVTKRIDGHTLVFIVCRCYTKLWLMIVLFAPHMYKQEYNIIVSYSSIALCNSKVTDL